MTYDRDVFWVRIVAWCLAIGNLVAGIVNLLAHNKTVAIACFIWFFSMLTTLWSMKAQQATRDLGRLIEAGLNAMRKEMEQD